MGAGASSPGALERLPDPVDEATAMQFLGMCFDRADWYVRSRQAKIRAPLFAFYGWKKKQYILN